ncbi:MAG TPA: hypothetical protein VF173_35380 [Thermoanaerobaculia bacterium]|nr:hypothetical protein [Thermoanaerobaculia bacterium]
MRVFRIVGLLGILAAAWSGTQKPAYAGTVTCSYSCSGHNYVATCYISLQSCCDLLPDLCPDPYVYEGGGCYDGPAFC